MERNVDTPPLIQGKAMDGPRDTSFRMIANKYNTVKAAREHNCESSEIALPQASPSASRST